MGALNIPASSLVYVDTSIVIYSVEKFPEYVLLLAPLWLRLQAGEIEIVSSELILMESLVLPLRNSNSILTNAYELLLLSSEMRLIPINQSILRQAANLRATTYLKTPDAIHAATASSVSCNQFITNDKGFRNVSGLPVVILNEVLAS
ncbi:MAG: PIN domain-containing protein [Rhizonema sp. PD38]|nr:PIN domain-containing protein [Rhizonema sp. PD38]